MHMKSFLINSGSMIIADPCKIFGNDVLILHNVVNGSYITYVHYNDKKEIIFIKVINSKYEFSNTTTIVDSDIETKIVFCASAILGIFDSNVFTEKTATQEFKNQFYDLCCSISFDSSGYGVVEDSCFVCYCVINSYKVHVIVNDKNEIVGVRIGLIKDIKNVNKAIEQF